MTVILLLNLALGLVLCFPYRERHRVESGRLIYTCSPGVINFFLAAVLIFLALPWWLPLAAPNDPGDLSGIALFAAGFSALWFAWARKYRVILSRHTVRAGALWFKEFEFTDIQKARLIRTALVIYSGAGGKLRVERQISDFYSFMAELRQLLPSTVKIEVL